MGAAFFCQVAALDTSQTLQNSTAYIQSCVRCLDSLKSKQAACSSIFVHDSVAPRALPKRPQNQSSTAELIQWLLRRVSPQGRSFDRPQSGWRWALRGRGPGEDACPEVKAGRCDESALQFLRPLVPTPPSGFLRRIMLRLPDVGLWRNICPLFSRGLGFVF
jgi:hypothetical protein